MKTFSRTAPLVVLALLSGCPEKERPAKRPAKVAVVKPPKTALDFIRDVHASLEEDCGRRLHKMKFDAAAGLTVPEADREEADKLLEVIGIYAQQCGSYSTVVPVPSGTCSPDCSWCPVKWYWCIENAGACAGGDNESCCKLGACGSKHHCKTVCESSCGCDVPPLPSSGGGAGGDDG